MSATCEYCYRQTDEPERHRWELIYQSYLCPACIEMAQQDGGKDWLFTTKGGAYAFGRKDPRAKGGAA